MVRFAYKLLVVAMLGIGLAMLGIGLAGLTVAGDDPKPAKQDWSGYVFHSTMTGTVDRPNKDGVFIKSKRTIPGTTPQAKPKVVTERLQFPYGDKTLVRWKALPQKFDEKGKKIITRTDKELKELKLPPGATGYAAERTDLVAGQIVEITMMRPKEIPLAKVDFQDLVVKQIVITGVDAAAMKEIEKKKKK